jgi:hypothetical protein
MDLEPGDRLVVFAAMSQVKRVRKTLELGGASPFEILRSPHCISSGGCSIAIRCQDPDIPLIVATATGLGIAPKGVYYVLRVGNDPTFERQEESQP